MPPSPPRIGQSSHHQSSHPTVTSQARLSHLTPPASGTPHRHSQHSAGAPRSRCHHQLPASAKALTINHHNTLSQPYPVFPTLPHLHLARLTATRNTSLKHPVPDATTRSPASTSPHRPKLSPSIVTPHCHQPSSSFPPYPTRIWHASPPLATLNWSTPFQMPVSTSLAKHPHIGQNTLQHEYFVNAR